MDTNLLILFFLRLKFNIQEAIDFPTSLFILAPKFENPEGYSNLQYIFQFLGIQIAETLVPIAYVP